jgi:hypothetical protein
VAPKMRGAGGAQLAAGFLDPLTQATGRAVADIRSIDARETASHGYGQIGQLCLLLVVSSQ